MKHSNETEEKEKFLKMNEILEKYNKSESSKIHNTDNWYDLLDKHQGSFEKILNVGYTFSAGYTENDLLGNPFIEFSYVLDLDDNTFKIYINYHNMMKQFKIEDIKTLKIE